MDQYLEISLQRAPAIAHTSATEGKADMQNSRNRWKASRNPTYVQIPARMTWKEKLGVHVRHDINFES